MDILEEITSNFHKEKIVRFPYRKTNYFFSQKCPAINR